jgi:hypothetical protein
VTGASFYTATVVLRPPLLCVGSAGSSDSASAADEVIVAVPTAHLVMAHPVGATTPDLLPLMAADAAAAYERGPDRLLPGLLRWSSDGGWGPCPGGGVELIH